MTTQHKNIVDIVKSWKKRMKSCEISHEKMAKDLSISHMTAYRWLDYDQYKILPSIKNIDKVEKYLKKQDA